MVCADLIWFDRKEDFNADYDHKHEMTITGKTATEVGAKLKTLRYNHDIAKYTLINVVDIYGTEDRP